MSSYTVKEILPALFQIKVGKKKYKLTNIWGVFQTGNILLKDNNYLWKKVIMGAGNVSDQINKILASKDALEEFKATAKRYQIPKGKYVPYFQESNNDRKEII